ncbi:MAG TPA: T9SS type A sorting domain-containing protein, partial [Candidatus Kapabacteria bacterium]|nr:T9SS type A sorting domain-containing protein [Candidatus Kapabacteria bacterium]
ALSTVTITLRANWNLLTPLSLSPAPGWSVLDTNTLTDGDFQIRIHHDVGGAVAAGTILVTCPLLITVSDSTGCDIGMSDLRFEDGSASYQDCVLSAVAMPDAVHFTETDTCGTPELRGLMEGRLALSIISVIPNPATITGGAAAMNVAFNLARAEDIRIIVRDVIGRECFSATKHFTAGIHTLNVDVPGAAEGMYFIQLEAEGQVAEAKVIVQSSSANLPK